jgi:hypothetical protein
MQLSCCTPPNVRPPGSSEEPARKTKPQTRKEKRAASVIREAEGRKKGSNGARKDNPERLYQPPAAQPATLSSVTPKGCDGGSQKVALCLGSSLAGPWLWQQLMMSPDESLPAPRFRPVRAGGGQMVVKHVAGPLTVSRRWRVRLSQKQPREKNKQRDACANPQKQPGSNTEHPLGSPVILGGCRLVSRLVVAGPALRRKFMVELELELLHLWRVARPV